MTQSVSFLTRIDNTLDVSLTNRPSLINRCEPKSGVNDHERAVFIDSNIMPRRHVRRKIYSWNRLDNDGLHKSLEGMADNVPSKLPHRDSSSPGPIPRSNECVAGRKSFCAGPLRPSLPKTELRTTRPKSILSQNVGRPAIATSMIWWPSPQRVNLTLLRDSGPSFKVGNVTTVLSPSTSFPRNRPKPTKTGRNRPLKDRYTVI